MAFSVKYRRSTSTIYVVATTMAVVVSASLWGQSRLNLSTSTLTTYEADPTALQLVRPLAEQRVMALGGMPVAASSSGGANSVGADGGIHVDKVPNNDPGGGGGGGGCGPDGPIWADIVLESNSGGGGILSGVQLHTGIYADSQVHLHLPQPGADWIISVDHNPRQLSSGGSYVDSDGFQGVNRFQGSAMELQAETDPPTNIYLISGANRYQEFALADGTTLFKAVNGGYGGAKHIVDSGGPDLVEVYDVHGNTYVFFGFDTQSAVVKGQLWKISDANGNTSYVGHATNASTAKTDGYDATTGRILKAYDAVDRRYTYTYTNDLLTEVKAETKTGGTWASPTGLSTVGKVNYTYYSNETYGDPGDLKMVKVTTPLTDSGAEIVTKILYRYYEGTYHPTTNPGHPHQIKYIYESEGLRQFDWAGDSTLDEDFLTASDDDLKPYASAFFKYEDDDAPAEHKRIIEAWFSGACGCSGGSGSGTFVFRYETNSDFSGVSGYNTEWHTRVIVKEPTKNDVSPNANRWVTTYFDEVGQVLAQVITEEDPANEPARFWATIYDRDWSTNALDGHVEFVHTPANVLEYDHNDDNNTGGWTASDGVVFLPPSTTTGLVQQFDRFTSGDYQGLVNHVKYKEGTSGTAYLQRSFFHDRTSETKTDGGDSITLARPVVDAHTVYTIQTSTADAGPGNSPPSGAYRTELTYDFYDDMGENAPLITEDITTTFPTVSTGNNGSNSATSTRRHFRKDARVDFAKAADGIITYFEYTGGRLTKVIQDADTTLDDTGEDFESVTIPTGYATDTPAAAFHMRRDMTYDRAGRIERTTAYESKSATIESEPLTYVSQLSDGRIITLRYPKFDASSTAYYGPVSMTVTNHAGGTDVTAIVALDDNGGEYTTDAQSTHVVETTNDPIAAVTNIGDLKRMTVQVYNKTGSRVDESRTYFVMPASGAGAQGTNYDTTLFGYDNSGRRWRVKDSTGTIRRTVCDKLGRTSEQWVGTNDNSSAFPGGETSGTADMVKVEARTYDVGSAQANSRLTKRTLFVEDSTTDQRETNYTYDFRGRMLLQANPTAPHIFNKYDDAGRLIASGQFSSTGSITIGSDDPTTEATNRLALSQTFYDEKGQVWKTQRHKIDASDGSDDDNLQELTWHDATGRVIKVDGGQLGKTFYDRLGRTTHQFILASIDDSVYADADDVSGDMVLHQNDTVYDPDSGVVLLTASIERHHDDLSNGTTGALDTNADSDALLYTAANIEGRVQINANWYDSLDRLEDTVSFGTNGGSNFNRTSYPTPPARSDDELRTTYVYNADGTTFSVTDPKGLITRFGYDDAGRQTLVINNYVDGTPSGPTGDDDVHTRYAFTDGMKTKMHVDLDGDGTEDADDQVTTWVYGVTKGTNPGDSKVGAGHLLLKVIYPEQTGSQAEADRRVSYAYNAQGQPIWTKDQTGTIIENNYDTSGRQTHRRVTTIDSSLDNSVLRVSTTYDSLGRRQLVTQYNNATVGSGTLIDEVKFTYDGWGNLAAFFQDRDSAVASSGGNDYSVAYTYAKAGSGAENGRNTIRRAAMTMPDRSSLAFQYSSSGGLHDDWASRVTYINYTQRDADPLDLVFPPAVMVAEYRYNGAGSVVGIDYPESDLFMHRYSGGSYGDLDRFNRVVGDRWWKDLATDRAFFDVAISYDRNSNIVRTEDNVHPAGKDIAYAMDGLNRLTDAQWGTWGGSSIGSEVRQRTWTLDQVGNWEFDKLDLNDDNVYTGAGEHNEDRTHNDPNELLGRDTDDNGTDNYTLTYNKRGDMTDDGQHYEYVYDAFGRLRQVNRTDNQALVSEYWYYGVGFRKSWKYDTNASGSVDGSDATFHFAYDERWRIAGIFRDSDTFPKELFVYHNAGADGYGSSSYIDAVILRDKDFNTGWTSASDGVLEQRRYYCQNWRADVVALLSDTGVLIEQARYDEYGRPFGIPFCDVNADGARDATDETLVSGWASGSYDVRGDIDLDGDVDGTDTATVMFSSLTTLGWGKLGSGAAGGNRKGYAGYEFDPVLAYSVWHVRHRVLNSNLGRWTRRDPLGFMDGPNLYTYVVENPIRGRDPSGNACAPPIIDGDCENGSACTENTCRFEAAPLTPEDIEDFGQDPRQGLPFVGGLGIYVICYTVEGDNLYPPQCLAAAAYVWLWHYTYLHDLYCGQCYDEQLGADDNCPKGGSDLPCRCEWNYPANLGNYWNPAVIDGHSGDFTIGSCTCFVDWKVKVGCAQLGGVCTNAPGGPPAHTPAGPSSAPVPLPPNNPIFPQ